MSWAKFITYNANHALTVAFKLLTTCYIFTLLFASQLVKKLEQDINELFVSTNASKMISKEICKSLEYYAMMYN